MAMLTIDNRADGDCAMEKFRLIQQPSISRTAKSGGIINGTPHSVKVRNSGRNKEKMIQSANRVESNPFAPANRRFTKMRICGLGNAAHLCFPTSVFPLANAPALPTLPRWTRF
jgi:hypothetical protein